MLSFASIFIRAILLLNGSWRERGRSQVSWLKLLDMDEGSDRCAAWELARSIHTRYWDETQLSDLCGFMPTEE